MADVAAVSVYAVCCIVITTNSTELVGKQLIDQAMVIAVLSTHLEEVLVPVLQE